MDLGRHCLVPYFLSSTYLSPYTRNCVLLNVFTTPYRPFDAIQRYCPDAKVPLAIESSNIWELIEENGDGVDNEHWAPVGEPQNGWVQVGWRGDQTCKTQKQLSHMNLLSLGTSGINSFEVTGYTMCCLGASSMDKLSDSSDLGIYETTSLRSKNPTPPSLSTKATITTTIVEATPRPTTSSPSISPTPPPTTSPPSISPTLPPTLLTTSDELSYYYSALSHEPIWYDRSKGWSGQTLSPAAQLSIQNSSVDEEFEEVYKMFHTRVDNKLQPIPHNRFSGWTGHTYSEALDFCDKESKVVCSYESLCPKGTWLGTSNHPIINLLDGPIWMPIDGIIDLWVEIRDQGQCAVQTNLEKKHDVTRYVLCCESEGKASSGADNGDVPFNVVPTLSKPAQPPTPPQSSSSEAGLQIGAGELDQIYDIDRKGFHPVTFTRSQGWSGSTYGEALEFCALQSSRVPCRYDAICPMASRGPPYGGVVGMSHSAWAVGMSHSAWAPIIDSANGWVQIGNNNTCMKFTDVNPHPPMWGLTGKEGQVNTPFILCCEEPGGSEPHNEKDEEMGQLTAWAPWGGATNAETTIISTLHPVWFGRKHGYHGTTHEEAKLFCRSVGNMHLCPSAAHCPNGPQISKALYLHKDAFEGEQWAPVSNHKNEGTSVGNSWIMIGKKDNNPYSTCLQYEEINDGKSAPWNADGSKTELKEHVLCCGNPNESMAIGGNIERETHAVWLDDSQGWKGGSYDDGVAFCQQMGGKELCTFTTYCPLGPGMQPIGGHDFNLEGEQWAPFAGKDNTNNWVLVGRKYGNSATTCHSHEQLEGRLPAWGLSSGNASVKRHIQCCVPSPVKGLEMNGDVRP